MDNIGQKSEENQESAKEKEQEQKENDNEEEAVDKLNEGRKIYKVSKSTQDCGNVFEGSTIFFEYVVNKEKRAEFKSLKMLPFQVQIEYHKKDGSKMMRVISQTKEITLDRNKVRSNLNFDVMAQYGQHVTTELCAKGDYESSRAWTSANTNYMNRNAYNNRQMFALANYAQQNVSLDHQMQRQIQTEQMMEMPKHYNAFRSLQSNSAAILSQPQGQPHNNLVQMQCAPQSSSMYGGARGGGLQGAQNQKKKKNARRSARNDQFSSAMYSMKSKAKKSKKYKK